MVAFAVAALCGCGSPTGKVRVHDVSEARAPKPGERVETFSEGAVPDRAYREVAVFSYNGVPGEYPEAVRAFQIKAEELGADGVIMLPTETYANSADSTRMEFRALAIEFND